MELDVVLKRLLVRELAHRRYPTPVLLGLPPHRWAPPPMRRPGKRPRTRRGQKEGTAAMSHMAPALHKRPFSPIPIHSSTVSASSSWRWQRGMPFRRSMALVSSPLRWLDQLWSERHGGLSPARRLRRNDPQRRQTGQPSSPAGREIRAGGQPFPSWCKDPTGGRKPINAKCETVHQLPTFRDAYRNRRCIVPSAQLRRCVSMFRRHYSPAPTRSSNDETARVH